MSNIKIRATVLVEAFKDGDWAYFIPKAEYKESLVLRYNGMVAHSCCTEEHPKRHMNINYIDINCSCKFSVVEDMLASDFWNRVRFINGD